MKTKLAAALTKHATDKGLRYYESLINVWEGRAVWSDGVTLLSAPSDLEPGVYDATKLKAQARASKALKQEDTTLEPKDAKAPPLASVFGKTRADVGSVNIHYLKQIVDYMASTAETTKDGEMVMLQRADGQLWITNKEGIEACVCFMREV